MKGNDCVPRQKRYAREGEEIGPTTACPLNSATDRELSVPKPYSGSGFFSDGEFMHHGTPRSGDSKE